MMTFGDDEVAEEDAEDDGRLDPAIRLALKVREHVRERRDAQQNLHQPVIKLRQEELPQRLGAVHLELIGAVHLEELRGALLAQALLNGDALLLEEFLHIESMCWRLLALATTAQANER